jgi:hypothetical protein
VALVDADKGCVHWKPDAVRKAKRKRQMDRAALSKKRAAEIQLAVSNFHRMMRLRQN